ncbi:UBC-like protein [Glarea lozoyensis ATCC 20868]|uniref:UBC-like protein n=1 Tax=Glarea lozoyensis (strain ATCC 20868 / MF5171) TaxID=1116229 RepID=S3D7E1_GLAL2|nr:UBC-like protein [Glarea lozoyensis ATCC 20868]EPE27926.1 UBC-like protein [Glarea lozoyensis ATCC 20868]
MAEVAGLVVGAVGVLGIFSACIECFDIVDAGRNYSKELEQLSALLALERLRFCIWGQTVGLAPRHDGTSAPYDKILDRPDIRPVVEQTLYNIKSLLDDAGLVVERYNAKEEITQESAVQIHNGLDIFRASYEQVKLRIRKQQTNASAWEVTRWAVHDAKSYSNTISRLQQFVDGLEKVTSSTHLAEQRALLQEEIENVSNVESLELLRDASSTYSGSLSGSSLSGSRLLTKHVAESILEVQTQRSESLLHGRNLSAIATGSYTTGSSSTDVRIPGAFPKIRSRKTSIVAPCWACKAENRTCSMKNDVLKNNVDVGSCVRCREMGRHCTHSFGVETSNYRFDGEPFTSEYPPDELIASESGLSPEVAIPQNQRIMNEVTRKETDARKLCFAKGDENYGKVLAPVKEQDDTRWINNSGQFLTHAATHSSAAKRMFFELRNIKSAKVPFVSAAPLQDSLDVILASIEGPPDTPYEGGIFWIIIRISESDPFGPPVMRFQTKIYHPNISPQGDICTDYSDKWRSVLSDGLHVSDSSAVWYPSKSTEIRWSLGALLVALCGLLASPDIDDPLVPEIARTYIEDYEGYCKAARDYTFRYATSCRPEEDALRVPAGQQDHDPWPDMLRPNAPSVKLPEDDSASIQQSWREKLEHRESNRNLNRSWSSISGSLHPPISRTGVFEPITPRQSFGGMGFLAVPGSISEPPSSSISSSITVPSIPDQKIMLNFRTTASSDVLFPMERQIDAKYQEVSGVIIWEGIVLRLKSFLVVSRWKKMRLVVCSDGLKFLEKNGDRLCPDIPFTNISKLEKGAYRYQKSCISATIRKSKGIETIHFQPSDNDAVLDQTLILWEIFRTHVLDIKEPFYDLFGDHGQLK